MLQTKCCWAPRSTSDGLRILATRYWVRGLPKSAADLWMPNLGPSEHLLKSYKAGQVTWPQFRIAFMKEILGRNSKAYPEPQNPRSRNSGQKHTLDLLREFASHHTITLMCHCESEDRCHRSLLRSLLA